MVTEMQRELRRSKVFVTSAHASWDYLYVQTRDISEIFSKWRSEAIQKSSFFLTRFVRMLGEDKNDHEAIKNNSEREYLRRKDIFISATFGIHKDPWIILKRSSHQLKTVLKLL